MHEDRVVMLKRQVEGSLRSQSGALSLDPYFNRDHWPLGGPTYLVNAKPDNEGDSAVPRSGIVGLLWQLLPLSVTATPYCPSTAPLVLLRLIVATTLPPEYPCGASI